MKEKHFPPTLAFHPTNSNTKSAFSSYVRISCVSEGLRDVRLTRKLLNRLHYSER